LENGVKPKPSHRDFRQKKRGGFGGEREKLDQENNKTEEHRPADWVNAFKKKRGS